MKQIYIILVLFILFNNSYSQYISPGVRFGYDFNSHFTFGVKVSFGVYDNGNAFNFTYGKKFAINNKSNFASHNYIDLQIGKLTKAMGDRKVQLFYGGGIGLIFYKDNGIHHYYPRITTFVGYLLFTTLDLNIIKWKKVEPDIGLQLVLPIPIGAKPSLGTGG